MRLPGIALCFLALAGNAAAGPLDLDWPMPGGAAVILAGHDNVDVPPAIARFSGSVAAVGAADPDGRVASFTSSIDDFAVNEVKSWRLTILSGALLGTAFVVLANTENEITVTGEGSLAGLVPGDLFVLEQVFTRRIIRVQ
jgi:hypothetical protein